MCIEFIYFLNISHLGAPNRETSTTSERSTSSRRDSHGSNSRFGDAKPNHDAAIAAGLVPVALVVLLGCLYWLYRRAHPQRQNDERSYTMMFTQRGEPRRETPPPPPSPTPSSGEVILTENKLNIVAQHLFYPIQFIYIANLKQVRVTPTRAMKALKLKSNVKQTNSHSLANVTL